MLSILFPSPRRGFAALFAVFSTLLIAACATPQNLNDDPTLIIEAPDYRVGDTWVYEVKDGYRLPIVWEETRAITEITEGGIVVSVSRRGERVNDTRTEIYSRPGMMKQGAIMLDETRVLELPFTRFRFPMSARQTWSQTLSADQKFGDAMNLRNGFLSTRTHAIGWGALDTFQGKMDALYLTTITVFDDANPWYYASRGFDRVWYAPAVNGVAYAEREVTRLEKSDPRSAQVIPIVHATFTLIAYHRGNH